MYYMKKNSTLRRESRLSQEILLQNQAAEFKTENFDSIFFFLFSLSEETDHSFHSLRVLGAMGLLRRTVFKKKQILQDPHRLTELAAVKE